MLRVRTGPVVVAVVVVVVVVVVVAVVVVDVVAGDRSIVFLPLREVFFFCSIRYFVS